jgi:IS1 family transposase
VNRLPIEKQADIAAHLVEGNSVRGTSRLCQVRLNTVLRNLIWLGEACYQFHGDVVRNLERCTRIEADEIWTFIYAKDRMKRYLPSDLRSMMGTRWTWIAMDPDRNLVINWHVGGHRPSDAEMFAYDLASRVTGDDIQITSDQLRHYAPAFEKAFGSRAHYATIKKIFRKDSFTPDGRYEPRRLRKNRKATIFGNPDPDFITTTTIESHNSSLREWNSRFHRNTKAFSKKGRNLSASLALHFTYFNFCRVHPSLGMTPAMASGITKEKWEIEELIERINVEESRKEPY